MLKDRKAYEDKLHEQLVGWEADIEALKAKAKDVGVDGMMAYDRTMEALKHKHEEAGVHFRQLKAAGDETWEHVKEGTEKVWSEFKALFGKASNNS